jgi:hypothetical protein
MAADPMPRGPASDDSLVREVLYRVPLAAAAGDDADWNACVTDDVVLYLPPEQAGTAGDLVPRRGLAVFARHHALVRRQLRMVVNPLVDVTGDTARADSVDLILDVEADLPVIARLERVEDVLRRGRHGRWQITQRTSTPARGPDEG